jgi:hypothetical protein
MALLLLVHMPPDVGESWVVPPSHISVAPVIETLGFVFTVILSVGEDAQLVLLFVNINEVVPEETAVTKPELSTVAIDGLLLIHVPPDEGLNCVVKPAHNTSSPIIETLGLFPTVTGADGFDVHPEIDSV